MLLVVSQQLWAQNDAYWQQKVQYRIKATLNDQNNTLEGTFYELTYTNQSPHTLQELYFHLVWNAYTPHSPYHNLQTANHKTVIFGDYESQNLGLSVWDVRVNGQLADTTSTNSIMRVKLPKPLTSGDSVKVTMQFKTYFSKGGNLRKRMKYYEAFGYKNYNGVHWYPIVSVFDKHFAWGTETELDKEYYADFGNFDVELDLPSNYILEATGNPLNRTETLPDSLRKALDLRNFRTKKWNEQPSELMPKRSGARKKWVFRAQNVHNFAFTASPLYRIAETEVDGTTVVVLVQEHHALHWQQTPQLCANLMHFYNQALGQYAYQRMIFADAAEGTECGQMALITSLYPNHVGLIAHELAHQWFQGMLGSNERYRAFLDEGFAEYATVLALQYLYGGDETEYKHQLKPFNVKAYPFSHRQARFYEPYLNYFWSGHDIVLNTHSSDFRSSVRQEGGYGLTYQKGGLMLENLRYVLGDELFFGALQHYIKTWKFKHPYPEDFRQSITAYTQTDLTWFFDQWLDTDKHNDYGIKHVKRLYKGKKFTYKITLERKGSMQMPIDLHLWDRDNQTYSFYIPNKWFKKKTTAQVLPQWIGWGKNLNPSYTTTVTLAKPLKRLEIDSSRSMCDVDMRDNCKGKSPRSRLKLDIGQDEQPYYAGYEKLWQPHVFYTGLDGLRLGVKFDQKYADIEYLSIKFWLNTSLLQNTPEWASGESPEGTGFWLKYQNRFSAYWPSWSYWADVWLAGGLTKTLLGIKKSLKERDPNNPDYAEIAVYHKFLRLSEKGSFYLANPQHWSRNTNSSFNFSYTQHQQRDKKNSTWRVNLRTPAMQSEFNYGLISSEYIKILSYKKAQLRQRYFLGSALNSQVPNESLIYLSGASPEMLADSPWTQTYGLFMPYNGQRQNLSFQQGGGLNVRGYGNAPMIYTDSTQISTPYFRGRSGASLSWEYGRNNRKFFWSKKLYKKLELDWYMFFDAALIRPFTTNITVPERFFANAGVGTAWRIKFPKTRYKPFVIRLDCPFWLSSNRADGQNFGLRAVLGIGRTF